MELHVVAKFLLHSLCGGEQLVHTLFVHNATHKEKPYRPLLRVSLIWIIRQIDSCTAEHRVAPLRHNTGRNERITVFRVLEEHDRCILQRRAVKRQHKFSEPAAVFNGTAKAGNVHGIGDARHPAGQTAVDVGLDGVSQDQIRLNFSQHGAILAEQLAIAQRIHPTAIDGCMNETAAKLHQFRDEITIRQ